MSNNSQNKFTIIYIYFFYYEVTNCPSLYLTFLYNVFILYYFYYFISSVRLIYVECSNPKYLQNGSLTTIKITRRISSKTDPIKTDQIVQIK